MTAAAAPRVRRRARPLLGTLVEIGLAGAPGSPAADDAAIDAAIDAGFAAVVQVQAALSRFDAASDLARFARLRAGASLAVRADTAQVLAAAAQLQQRSGGRFDLSLGSGPHDWHCAAGRLHKHRAGVVLDAGGIAKGHALDRAVAALQAAGAAAGWVNAGGDLRTWGGIEVPVWLRDEARGGTRCLVHLADGALATSHFAPGSRCALAGGGGAVRHVSVAAPTGLWADALTKVAALGTPRDCAALLDDLGATAWWH